MQVRRQLGHLPTLAWVDAVAAARTSIRHVRHGHPRRGCGACRPGRRQLVLQSQHDQVAWMHAQRRRLRPVRCHVAEPGTAVGRARVAQPKLDLQDTVDAAKIMRLAHQDAGLGPLANFRRCEPRITKRCGSGRPNRRRGVCCRDLDWPRHADIGSRRHEVRACVRGTPRPEQANEYNARTPENPASAGGPCPGHPTILHAVGADVKQRI